MLNTIIIEDEKPAMEMLEQTLRKVSPEINITAKLHSVRESVEYFSTKRDAHLIFSDIRLQDGLSFDIFSAMKTKIPVIFTTGYDEHVMRAFENYGIHYLLKPIFKEEVEKALLKYNRLASHFLNSAPDSFANNMLPAPKKKTRLLVKSGVENMSLLLENIALLYTQDKVVYVIDGNGKKYLAEKTLGELEEELDSHKFFRANRQYIINIDF